MDVDEDKTTCLGLDAADNCWLIPAPSLQPNKEYWVEVGATRTVNSVTYLVWSEPFTATALDLVEPFRAWFIDDTPNPNHLIGRVFMMIDSNLSTSSAVCFVNGGQINCPPRTLVSLDIEASGIYSMRGRATNSALVATTSTQGGFLAGGIIARSEASGGENELAVRWDDVIGVKTTTDSHCQDNTKEPPDCDNEIITFEGKKLVSYVINYEKDGEHVWVKKGINDRTHTITGLDEGEYAVYVHPCVNDISETSEKECKKRVEKTVNGVTRVTYETESGAYLGASSKKMVVTLADGQDEVPLTPTDADVFQQANGKIWVTWSHPDQSGKARIHSYRVRYAPTGGSPSYEIMAPLIPHDIISTSTHTVLTGRNVGRNNIDLRGKLNKGTQYTISIQAQNVNGNSAWVDAGTVTP
ncbi:MAG: fibronectin type III domain-containing protein [Chloroflexi bacterium]|nr:fibronectin type III domain-containing protein [Chloroflexota bacterium]